MEPIIEILGLARRYGKQAAVRDLDLVSGPGEIHGLLGPNGSGKTTTLRCVSGVLQPDEGVIRIAGETEPIARKQGIGAMLGTDALFPWVRFDEHLLFEARVRGIDRAEAAVRCSDLLALFDLTDAAKMLSQHGSMGMRKRLSIALALVHRPPVVILDEPFEGLDPVAVARTVSLLDALRAGGTGILITSHRLDVLAEHADRFTLIRDGRVVDRGTGADLEASYRRRFVSERVEVPTWLG